MAALQALTEWLEAERVPYAAIGGVAVSLLAQPRATQDIDAVIWLEQERWGELLEVGAAYGFTPRISAAVEFAARSRVLLLRHVPSGISIDLSCAALTFEQELIERAVTLDLGGVKLKVPTPEDLLITKAVAHRPKDLIDIEAIIEAHPRLDVRRIQRWTQEFSDALEMPEIMESIEHLLRQ